MSWTKDLTELPLIMTVEEVSDVLGVDRKTVYEAIHREEIQVVRLGRVIRVPRQSLGTYLGIETTNGLDSSRKE